MTLTLLSDRMAVCRLEPDVPEPEWAAGGSFSSVTRTADECSVVCAETVVPDTVQAETGWRMLKVVGPLEFHLTGILAALAGPLAAARIPIFVLSTFETDYLLVKSDTLEHALQVLQAAGHEIVTFS